MRLHGGASTPSIQYRSRSSYGSTRAPAAQPLRSVKLSNSAIQSQSSPPLRPCKSPMPAERAPMRKVREVLRLHRALGVGERQIAITIGISRSIVLRRAAVIGIIWSVPEGMDTAELK